MVWGQEIDGLADGRVRRVRMFADGRPLPYDAVLALWQGDESFRSHWLTLLTEAPYDAYFWETPPVTRETTARPFEFVLVESPALARLSPDPAAFARYFAGSAAAGDVAAFPNLGGDAVLVAPAPIGSDGVYTHLAAFVRHAPLAQQHAVWRAVGVAMAEHLSDRPLWLSTSGLGVAWLHLRLDSRPKYYTFGPYRRAPGDEAPQTERT